MRFFWTKGNAVGHSGTALNAPLAQETPQCPCFANPALQDDVTRVFRSMKKSTKSFVNQVAVAIEASECYMQKMAKYVQDLPGMLEHGAAVQDAVARLQCISHFNMEAFKTISEVCGRLELWRGNLRGVHLKALEDHVVEKVRLVTTQILESEGFNEHADELGKCLPEVAIAFPLLGEVSTWQSKLAAKLKARQNEKAKRNLKKALTELQTQCGKTALNPDVVLDYIKNCLSECKNLDLKDVINGEVLKLFVQTAHRVVETVVKHDKDAEKLFDESFRAQCHKWLQLPTAVEGGDSLDNMATAFNHFTEMSALRKQFEVTSDDNLIMKEIQKDLAWYKHSQLALVLWVEKYYPEGGESQSTSNAPGWVPLMVAAAGESEEDIKTIVNKCRGVYEAALTAVRAELKELLAKGFEWAETKNTKTTFAELQELAATTLLALRPTKCEDCEKKLDKASYMS